jgi:fatty-acid peroxygenase
VAGRWQLGRWAERVVRDARTGVIAPPPGSVLHAVSTRPVDGRRLAPQVAAAELLNFVRPTVAVTWFVAFAGLALAEHPEWRERVRSDQAAARAFAHEVRRRYPFVPVLAARTRSRQSVLGVPLRRGGLVVLDVHGTTHDPQVWPDPETFDPERFRHGSVDPDALVPQGGGDVRTGHRCPGEDVTLTMIEVAVRSLAAQPYALAEPHPSWDLTRMPTRPADGVRLRIPAAA